MKKNYVKYSMLISTLIWCIGSSKAKADIFDIPDSNLFYPHKIASKVKVAYDSDQKEFTAFLDGRKKKINRYDVSDIPTDLNGVQLKNFLKIGYFSLNKIGGDYSLKANFRLNGGSGNNETPPNLDKTAKIQTSLWVVDSALSTGGHRTTGEWMKQGNHRTPSEWWNQGNHRSIGEWFSGVPSKNSKNSKK